MKNIPYLYIYLYNEVYVVVLVLRYGNIYKTTWVPWQTSLWSNFNLLTCFVGKRPTEGV